jgi:ABC-type nitrate/sulfonate/bicarbonate transport system substrate-binding protein
MLVHLHRSSIVARYLAAVAVVFSFSSTVMALDKVRLAQNLSPISGVTIVAQDQGFFTKYDLDVSVSNFTSGKLCLQTVMGGAADIATTAEAPTSAAAMAKEPIAFLARTEYSELKTLTAKAAGIKSMSDLKGKRIAFTAGTGSEVYTSALLKKAGLTADDVKLINLRPQDMAAALASDSIDAFNIWEPHVFNASRVMGDKTALLPSSGVYAESFNIVVMQDYLAKNADVIDRFMKALIDAEAWMKANEADAIKVVAATVKMPEADLAAMWKEYVFNVVLDDRTMDILNTHADWRLATGNHPPGAVKPDFTDVIFPGPLRSIDPSRVTASALNGIK